MRIANNAVKKKRDGFDMNVGERDKNVSRTPKWPMTWKTVQLMFQVS